MTGLGFTQYFGDNFNTFDCVVVIASIIDTIVNAGDGSLSVLQSFRLFRIFQVLE